jgi:hypothetical protein
VGIDLLADRGQPRLNRLRDLGQQFGFFGLDRSQELWRKNPPNSSLSERGGAPGRGVSSVHPASELNGSIRPDPV